LAVEQWVETQLPTGTTRGNSAASATTNLGRVFLDNLEEFLVQKKIMLSVGIEMIRRAWEKVWQWSTGWRPNWHHQGKQCCKCHDQSWKQFFTQS